MYRKEDITLHSSSSSTSRDGEIVFNVGNDIEEQPPEKPGVASIFYPVLKFLPEDVSKKFLNASKRCLIASIVGFAAVIVLVVSLSVTLSNQNGSTSSSSLGLNLNSTTFSPKDEPETNIGFVPPSPTRVPSISPNDEPDITIGFKPLDIARPTEANNVSATSSESSVRPTQTPAAKPASQKPSQKPVVFPKTDFPTAAPTVEPTETPTINLLVASNMETIDNDNQQSGSSNTEDINTHVTYMPGNLSTHMEHGLLLSQGLGVRLIAQSGQTVDYADGSQSEEFFHFRPDAGATFTDVRHHNRGGWVYVSNAEIRHQDKDMGEGGVGSLTFDSQGRIINYKRVLNGTSWNCGGGKTPWNTWVSCEEAPNGNIYQVDPFDRIPAEKLTLGSDGGSFESFAYDVRNKLEPRFFVTEDHRRGAIQRFTPNYPDWTHPWKLLHSEGKIEYLVLEPNEEMTGGTFRWTSDRTEGRDSARDFYPNCEGIDAHHGRLFFVSKRFRQLYELDLDSYTYTNTSTIAGLFDGGADQLQRIMKDGGKTNTYHDVLYFTEEGGKDAGIHGRNEKGDYFTVLESPVYHDEVTGLAFSPDGLHMYLAYQVNGLLFDVFRKDGLPFQEKHLNIQYHGKPGSVGIVDSRD